MVDLDPSYESGVLEESPDDARLAATLHSSARSVQSTLSIGALECCSSQIRRDCEADGRRSSFLSVRPIADRQRAPLRGHALSNLTEAADHNKIGRLN